MCGEAQHPMEFMVDSSNSADAGDPEADLGRVGYTRPERYLASFLDNLLAFLLMMCIATVLSENMQSTFGVVVNVAIGIGFSALYFAYFLIFEATISSTPGKLMFSLRVQHLNGTKCSLRAACLRTMTRFLEVNPLLFGCVPAAIVVRCSKRKQRWGDILANTIVTNKKLSKPAKAS